MAKKHKKAVKSATASSEPEDDDVERQMTGMVLRPGLSFLDALLWQLELHENVDVWNVALHVLHHVATTPHTSWRAFFSHGVSVEIQRQRAEQFRRHGLTKLLKGLRVDSQKYDVVVYVLDRCCGICDRDWTASRLCCDDLFVQAFANWSKSAIRIYAIHGGDEPILVTPYQQPHIACAFTFEVAREGERYTRKSQQGGRSGQGIAEVSENMLGKISHLHRDPYWNLHRLDVWAIAHDMVFAKTLCDPCDSETPSSASTDADSELSGEKSITRREERGRNQLERMRADVE